MYNIFKNPFNKKEKIKSVGFSLQIELEKIKVFDILFDFESNKNLYNFIDKQVHINNKLYTTEDYKKINSILNNPQDSVEFILSHEVSHAIHHQSLSVYQQNYNHDFNGFIELQSKYERDLISNLQQLNIKHHFNENVINLENFLYYQKNNPISEWFHHNFAEGFADSTAIVLKVLKNNLPKDDVNKLIDGIYTYRKNDYNSIKSLPTVLKVNDTNSTLEIWEGKFTSSAYCNFESLTHLKDGLFNQFSNDELNNLSKPLLYSFINAEVLNGLHDSIVKECNTNPLFAYQLKQCCKTTPEKTINQWMESFQKYIIKYKEENLLKYAREKYYTKHLEEFKSVKNGITSNSVINIKLSNPSNLLSIAMYDVDFKPYLNLVLAHEVIPDIQTLRKDFSEYDKKVITLFKKLNFTPLSYTEIKSEILKTKMNKDTKYLLTQYLHNFSIPCHHTNKPQLSSALSTGTIVDSSLVKEEIKLSNQNIMLNIKSIRKKLTTESSQSKLRV